MHRRFFLAQSAALGGTAWGISTPAQANANPSSVVLWNRQLLQAVAESRTPVTIAARTMAMVHEAIYNAWAHYDSNASFSQPRLVKRPSGERNAVNRRVAISHAAHTVLLEMYPGLPHLFEPLLLSSIADAANVAGSWEASDAGRQAGWRVLQSRRNDGANQHGDLAPGAYADWTGYQSVNTPDLLVDPDRWQPLRLPDAAGNLVVQRFLTPHWGRVRPFVLPSGSSLRPSLDPLAPTQAEVEEVIALSAGLNDRSKALGDFFAQNPGAVTPPGQWLQIAEEVSRIDGNNLDRDVRLFFATAQACLDASIAAWDAKRFYDQARPISVIPHRYRGQLIQAWGGPGLGTQTMSGEQWITWQRPVNRTPPFPDFVSGHSTFSAAAATAIAAVRGSNNITLRATVPAGAFRTDPGLPLADVQFVWNSLSEVADAAGYSRRVTGLHWQRSDLAGRSLGRLVGGLVAIKCLVLVTGAA